MQTHQSLEKDHPPLSQQHTSKNRDLPKPPHFENLAGGSTSQ